MGHSSLWMFPIYGSAAFLAPLMHRLQKNCIWNLLSLLGNPQDQLTFVHIAGTNGKGSVLAYVSTVLKEAGSDLLWKYRIH